MTAKGDQNTLPACWSCGNTNTILGYGYVACRKCKLIIEDRPVMNMINQRRERRSRKIITPKRDYLIIFVTADGVTDQGWIKVRKLPKYIWRELGGEGRVFTSRQTPQKAVPKPLAFRPYRLFSRRLKPIYKEDFVMPICQPPKEGE